MTAVEISSIKIDRDSRQRRELTGLDEMMDSLKRRGQIQNIVITASDRTLVAGERRLEAARKLGWTHIEATFRDELDPKELHAIELEENVKRANLTWQDECRAVKEYHEFRKEEEDDWSVEKTAAELGYSPTHVHARVNVANEIAAGNAMVTAAPKFSTARGIVERAQSRAVQQDILGLKETIKAPSLKEAELILNEDFLKWAPAYTGPKFNFIHCDFPYGIGADKFNQGSASAHGGYDDSEEVYWRLLDCFCTNLDRFASPSCHIMFWFSMHFYDGTRDYFHKRTDFRIDPFPLVWTKSDNIGILPDPERGPRRIYETALFGSRGDRKIVRPVSNSFPHPSQRDEHMSIKPQAMLENFFRMFVDTSTIMLDPTCGSGGAVRAARVAGAQSVLGLEVNAEFAARAQLALKTGGK